MSEKERKNLQFLCSQYIRYKERLAPRIEEWRRFYKVAKAFREVGTWGYKYNVNKPIALLFIETFVSNVLNPIFQSKDLIDIQPAEGFHFTRPEIQDAAVARQLNRCINKMLRNPDLRFRIGVRDMIKSLAYYGTAIAQVFPAFGRKEEGYPYLGPSLKLQQVYNVIPNPYARAPWERTDLFIREVVIPEELRFRERTMGYKHVDKILKMGSSEEGGNQDTDIQLELEHGNRGRRGHGGSSDGTLGPDRLIFLAHYYDGRGGVRTMANGEVVVYNSMDKRKANLQGGGQIDVPTHPYQYYDPFETLRINEGPAEYYGIGIAALSEMTQKLMNLRAAQRNENIELALQKCFIIHRYAGIELDELNMIPGGIILTDNMDGIQPLEMNDVTRGAHEEDDADFRFTEQLVSTPQISRGQTPQRRVTATTGSQLLQQSQQRANVLQADIIDMITSVARKTAVQIRMYMPKEQYERMIGEPDAGLYQLEISEVNNFLDFDPLWRGNEQEAQMRFQKLVQFYQMGLQDPFVNRTQLIQEIGMELFPNKDPRRYLMDPQQMMQQAAMQQAAGGVGGASPPGQSGQPKSPEAGQGGSDYKSQNPGQTERNVAQGGNA